MKYSELLDSILFPAYYNLRGRAYPRLHAFMEQSQWWSRSQVEDFQWREARLLLEHAFRSVSHYRKKYSAVGIELGDIKTREDFAKLPPLSREEVNKHRADLCSQASKGRLIRHATGGSSGVPTSFYITLDSYDWRCAASARAYSWTTHRHGERTLYLWGAPVGRGSFLNEAKVNVHRWLKRELVIPTFAQTTELWEQTFHAALRFRPRFMVGYVSSLQQFAQFLLDHNLSIPGIKAVIAAAEPVYQSTRDLILDAFQAPLFNSYGSREFMSIAAECEYRDGLHIHAENLLVEVENNPNGAGAELLITDLHNFGMPFIRYRIGDLGSFRDSNCCCGRGLPLLLRVEGRILEVLRTADGRTVPGEFFPHLMKEVCEVREFQVQQRSLEDLVVSVVLAQPFSDRSERLLRQEMARVFTPKTRVTINSVQSIPRLPSGKRRIVIGLS